MSHCPVCHKPISSNVCLFCTPHGLTDDSHVEIGTTDLNRLMEAAEDKMRALEAFGRPQSPLKVPMKEFTDDIIPTSYMPSSSEPEPSSFEGLGGSSGAAGSEGDW